MTWIDFLWPLVTGACVTLGLIHLRIGYEERPRTARLLFSLSAFFVAFVSVMELLLMRANSPARYEALLPWGDLATWATLTALTGFIWVFFGTGNKWIGLAGSATYGVGLLFYLGSDSGLLYLKITGLKTVETYGGATFRVAEGVPNPWGSLAYVGILLMLIFAVDASVRLWRRGNRRRSVVVGGSLVFFILATDVHSALIERGVIHSPYLISWFYLAIIIAMGNELTRDVFAATKLSRALRVAEERMSLAVEGTQLALWDWDLVNDKVWMTEEGRRFFGFASDEPIDYATLAGRVHPDDRAARTAAIKDALTTGGSYDIEYRVILPDGAVRWIAARGRSPGHAGNNSPPRLLGISMDITRQKQAAAEAQQQREELAHLSRAATVSALSGSLAHELNQPLASILSNAQAALRFLANDPPDLADLRPILADIVSEDRRAGEIIHRLRTMLRRGEAELQPVNVHESLEELLRLISGDLDARGVAVSNQIADVLPPVMTDRVQLQQVLLNLIVNACDAMESNPPEDRKLTLTTSILQNELHIGVLDCGVGLPDDVESVFQPFHSTKNGGLGMGLSICRTLLTAHCGRLWASPGAGRGAAFYVALPLAKEGA